MNSNPIMLEIYKNRFSSVAEEMGVTLQRTSYSPNIKERRDFSCAVFDKNGKMISQAAHIPVHLGSMPLSVETLVSEIDLKKGDMAFLNDPFKGGTHLPDITLVSGVFAEGGKPVFFVANRAHHADVGGMTSGSMPLSRSIFQEGLIIPPLKIIENGRLDEKLMKFFLNNVRTPFERQGDFSAQIMANLTGVRRMEEIIERNTLNTVSFYAGELIDYSEKIMRQTLKKIPDGIYSFEDYLDSDGIDSYNIKIKATVEIRGDEAEVDFSQSADQVKGSVNAVRSITCSAVLYAFRCLVEQDIPANEGCMRPLKVITRKGSVVDAVFPSAVAGGNVETSQRIVDVLFGTLSKAIPEKISAASQGTMNNITIGGYDSGKNVPFTYYETIGGGMGASKFSDGESAVHSHMTNTLNTPVEALEYAYPFIVKSYSIRSCSGGKGKHTGGNGIVREIRLLEDSEVTVLSERRTLSPYGLSGGENGSSGKNFVCSEGSWSEYPGKFSVFLKKGSSVRIETPGGGGFGKLDPFSEL